MAGIEICTPELPETSVSQRQHCRPSSVLTLLRPIAYNPSPVDDTLTAENAGILLALCRAGKLYEIEDWIASGKSLRAPPEKKTPLDVAILRDSTRLVE